MKRVFVFAALFLCLGLSSCQCAEKPDVGPVEGEDSETETQSNSASTASADAVRVVLGA